MNHEFAFLQLTREELADLHRATLSRFIMEQSMRREQGLEPVEEPALLERLERMLDLVPEEAHDAYHLAEDELWEYAWFAYTDEWAWFRAKREVTKELGSRAKRLNQEELDRCIEERYQQKFNRYVAEVDMHEGSKVRKSKIKSSKSNSKKNPS